MTLCPRCERNHYTPYGEPWDPGDPLPPAVSRMDDQTHICSKCGEDEAMRDFTRAAPVPLHEWPIKEAS